MVLSVALPIYNEQRVLERLHALPTESCLALGCSYELLYVDDGSTDGTADVLERIAREDPHVSIVTFSRNFGLPAALD